MHMLALWCSFYECLSLSLLKFIQEERDHWMNSMWQGQGLFVAKKVIFKPEKSDFEVYNGFLNKKMTQISQKFEKN